MIRTLIMILSINTILVTQTTLQELRDNFKNPPMDCWPHTRWWWPGNPVSKEEITWELEAMRRVGIRGVEQITMSPVYEKGNIPYMSEKFLAMAEHAVKEAKRLGMEISFNFGGPGWIVGGDWVPEEDKSKDMIPTSKVVIGPQKFRGKLPRELKKTERSWELYESQLGGDEKLLAVVAGRIVKGVIEKESLILLTSFVNNEILDWQVPAGEWRIMCFWLARNGHGDAVGRNKILQPRL